MVVYLLEELCITFEEDELGRLLARLRGEASAPHESSTSLPYWYWNRPREGLVFSLCDSALHRIRITYRGLRRIDELQDLLRRDRVLEDFGVLVSIRYFNRDVEHALERSSDVPVSVIYADMDDFGPINKRLGQDAGDVVMKAYLEVVRDSIGLLGTGYRGVGDETVCLVVGQDHDRAVELAEAIRQGVADLKLEYNGHMLPRVTASIGVATTPPEDRTRDISLIAENRKRDAKEAGKNRVVAIRRTR